jgi:hypothetical protein
MGLFLWERDMSGGAIQLRERPVVDFPDVPDHLVRATLRAAVRVTRQYVPLPIALSQRIAWLVRTTLEEGGEPCPTVP